jgi:S-disulfanyl-L-cysteine oxidoreductase SoxD
MSISRALVCVVLISLAGVARADGPALGQPLSPDEIPIYARYIMPDGTGLPAGSGSAAEGAEVYLYDCAICHGDTGIEGPVTPFVGPNDVWPKPAGLHWPHATTLFDYIRRAMPFYAPKSLSDDEVYAVTAYILWRNGVIKEDAVLDANTLPQVAMPNTGNFIDVWSLQGDKPW